MADFVAVLKKTIDGLGNNTPEMRERVYEKARATVAAKLAAISPPPPAALAERQKRMIEEAITEVEASYGGEAADPAEGRAAGYPGRGRRRGLISRGLHDRSAVTLRPIRSGW